MLIKLSRQDSSNDFKFKIGDRVQSKFGLTVGVASGGPTRLST